MSPRDLIVSNLSMIALAVLWGTMIPSIVVLLEIWDAYFLGMIRYVLAIPPFLLLLLIVERRIWLPHSVSIGRLFMLGFIGYGVYSTIFTFGIALSHPITAVIIISAAPVVGAAVGRIFFGIPIERRLLPAIVLAVIGAALATYDPTATGIPFALTGGELLLIGAMGCWNWYSLAAQRWLSGMSQLRITALTVISGGTILPFIYFGAVALDVTNFPPAAPRDGGDVLIMAWIICGCILGGVVLWHWGVKKFGIVIPNLYMNLTPAVAIGLSAAIGYVPTTMQLIGGALVIGGILASQLTHLVGSKQAQATQTTGDPA